MDQERIGKFIAERRKEMKLTQEELAGKLGVNNKTISRWETGKYMPDLSLFPLLSDVLGVSVNDLMSGEIVDKKNYQSKFEKNVTNAVSKVEKKSNVSWYVAYGVALFIGIMFLIGVGAYFYTAYDYTLKYEEGMIKITTNGVGSFTYEFVNKYPSSSNYLIDSYTESNGEKIGLVFIKAKQTLQYLKWENDNYENCYNANHCSRSSQTFLYSKEELPSKFKVYYTTYEFKDIIKANDKKLEKIIKNSNLIFDNTNA